ncbi:glycoside hydrolase family 1 protein [Candidatus Kaiserbacteria bacterium]|nr:glycoside hydrolase family 1 protein [Candidatus Kaiserbacteria bacterium]
MTFPEGFYWGAATASYQVEGGIENTDWAQAAREGRVPPCGRAADHYNRYEEDFDIAKSLGHNCHRISVEWARIEPEEGTFNEKEIEHYLAVLAALRARHIKPFVTLWHFTLPQWFAESGGWERKDAPEIFARYCGYVARKLGNDCRHFATMNEPTVFAGQGWLTGSWPPFKKWLGLDLLKAIPVERPDFIGQKATWHNVMTYLRVRRHLIRAHNLAYDAIKAAAFGAEVGIVHHIVLFHANGNPFNKLLAWIANWHATHAILSRVYRKCDSIGINYYQHKKFGDNATYDKTDMGWDVYPEGLCDALLMVKRYKLPIWVSEAGVADAADRIRADYIKRLVRCMHVAIENGADVRGFMYWSLIDNYEWALGFEKRFGLVEIDYQTLERKIRPSAYAYKEIIERNAMLE